MNGNGKILWVAALCLLAAALLAYLFWGHIDDAWAYLVKLQDKKEKFREWIHSFGPWGPAVFIGVQVFQVVFSPIPGE